jgi:hypothetical protein
LEFGHPGKYALFSFGKLKMHDESFMAGECCPAPTVFVDPPTGSPSAIARHDPHWHVVLSWMGVRRNLVEVHGQCFWNRTKVSSDEIFTLTAGIPIHFIAADIADH